MTSQMSRNEREQHIWDTYLAATVNEFPSNGSTINDSFRDWAVHFVLNDQGISVEEALDATAVDGSGDKGIDAWHVSQNSETEYVLNIFQSKNTRLDYDAVSKLMDSIKALYDASSSIRATSNSELLSRVVDFEQLLEQPDYDISISIYFVTSKTTAQATKDRVNDIKTTSLILKGRSVSATVTLVDIDDFANRLSATSETDVRWTFKLQDGQWMEFTPQGSFKTIIAAVNAQDIANLYNDHDYALFRLNPRFTLGVRTNTNSKIINTLTSDGKAHFFHYNNGITVLCESLVVSHENGTAFAHATDVQIVNGCQTTSSIWHAAYNRGQDLRHILVNVRLIEAGRNQAIAKTIATTTNDQNPLKAEDARSNEDINTVLSSQFDRMAEPWFYEYKRGMWRFADASKETTRYKQGPFATRRVGLKDLIQATLAFQGLPDEALDRVRFIFEKKQNLMLSYQQGLQPRNYFCLF